MLTEEDARKAIALKSMAEDALRQYTKERIAEFETRLKTNPIFTDGELIYSQRARCPCGHGLAYPKGCGPHHYWDCSAILKGIADKTVTHVPQMPFVFYKVKTESQNPKISTRPTEQPEQA